MFWKDYFELQLRLLLCYTSSQCCKPYKRYFYPGLVVFKRNMAVLLSNQRLDAIWIRYGFFNVVCEREGEIKHMSLNQKLETRIFTEKSTIFPLPSQRASLHVSYPVLSRILWVHVGPHRERVCPEARSAMGPSLVERRQNQRLTLFYKVLINHIDIDKNSLDLDTSTARTTKRSHEWTLKRPNAKDKHSPLWTGTVLCTIPLWNYLPSSTVTAGSINSHTLARSPPTSAFCRVWGCQGQYCPWLTCGENYQIQISSEGLQNLDILLVQSWVHYPYLLSCSMRPESESSHRVGTYLYRMWVLQHRSGSTVLLLLQSAISIAALRRNLYPIRTVHHLPNRATYKIE